jgi:hypothetical protein
MGTCWQVFNNSRNNSMPVKQALEEEKKAASQYYTATNTYTPGELRSNLFIQGCIGLVFIGYTAFAGALTGLLVATSGTSVWVIVFIGFLWVLWLPCLIVAMLSCFRTILYLIMYQKNKPKISVDLSSISTVTVDASHSLPQIVNTPVTWYTTELKQECLTPISSV